MAKLGFTLPWKILNGLCRKKRQFPQPGLLFTTFYQKGFIYTGVLLAHRFIVTVNPFAFLPMADTTILRQSQKPFAYSNCYQYI